MRDATDVKGVRACTRGARGGRGVRGCTRGARDEVDERVKGQGYGV